MPILTRSDKGSDLTVNEIDDSFLSTWEVITALHTVEKISFNTGPSFILGPTVSMAYFYATRFNMLYVEVEGSLNSNIYWYPSWRYGHPSNGEFADTYRRWVTRGQSTGSLGNIYDFRNATGAKVTQSTTGMEIVGGQVATLKMWGGHGHGSTTSVPTHHSNFEMNYRSMNYGSLLSMGRIEESVNTGSMTAKKIGFKLRAGTNSTNVNFGGSIRILGLRNRYDRGNPTYQYAYPNM